MNTFEKSCALIECYEQLENALNEITDIDSEDEKLTDVWWEIKHAIDSVNGYIRELNK
jgi:hypothetical protein